VGALRRGEKAAGEDQKDGGDGAKGLRREASGRLIATSP
jgi:hypothetical protein